MQPVMILMVCGRQISSIVVIRSWWVSFKGYNNKCIRSNVICKCIENICEMVHFQLPNSFTILLFPSFFLCYSAQPNLWGRSVIGYNDDDYPESWQCQVDTICLIKTGQRTGRGICQYIGREQHFKPAFPHSSKPRAPIGQGTTHCFK